MPPEIIGSSIPILRDDSSDYSKEGNNFPTYDPEIKIKPGDTPTAEIFHKLEGNSLVSQLLTQGKAKFGCELIFLGSFRREFHFYDGEYSTLNCEQIISWNASDVSQKLFFRPVIVASEEIEKFTLSSEDQVSEFWIGAEVSIPKFATLADAKERTLSITTQSILRIQLDVSFSNFEMDVKRNRNIGRSHFVVSVGKSLHQLLSHKSSGNADLRRAVLVNALTGVFGILMSDFVENPKSEQSEIEQCVVLSSLRKRLDDLGVCSWEITGDFSPIRAASKFEKLTWESAPKSGDDDDA